MYPHVRSSRNESTRLLPCVSNEITANFPAAEIGINVRFLRFGKLAAPRRFD